MNGLQVKSLQAVFAGAALKLRSTEVLGQYPFKLIYRTRLYKKGKFISIFINQIRGLIG